MGSSLVVLPLILTWPSTDPAALHLAANTTTTGCRIGALCVADESTTPEPSIAIQRISKHHVARLSELSAVHLPRKRLRTFRFRLFGRRGGMMDGRTHQAMGPRTARDRQPTRLPRTST
ncbi:hypothetical protein L209DRAFT_462284 [Thermothelomyces heterothallicus CBS 203.75]